MKRGGDGHFPRSRREGEKVSRWKSGKGRRQGHEQEKRNRCPSDNPLLSGVDLLLRKLQSHLCPFVFIRG